MPRCIVRRVTKVSFYNKKSLRWVYQSLHPCKWLASPTRNAQVFCAATCRQPVEINDKQVTARTCTDVQAHPKYTSVYSQGCMWRSMKVCAATRSELISKGWWQLASRNTFASHKGEGNIMHGCMDQFTSVNEALRIVVVVPSAQACIVVYSPASLLFSCL